MVGNPGTVSTENIDGVILRLLRLESGTELDYQTYFQILKKKIASHRLTGRQLPLEEQNILDEELKRVWRIKERGQRFKVKEKKVNVSMPSGGGSKGPGPSRGDGGGGGSRPPKTGSIVKYQKGKLTTDNFLNTNFVNPVSVKDVTGSVDILEKINLKLDSILGSLKDIYNFEKTQADKRGKEFERNRRSARENELESKPFKKIKKVLSKITKPFESIWNKIVNFITNVILGRIVIKLIDWFADPKNQKKVQSIIRFFGDHWPTLLALYLRFGTSFGRFVGKLGKVLIRGAFKLGALAAQLAAKAGLKGAAKYARFLGGPRGKAIATGIGIAADIGVTTGAAIGLMSLSGSGNEKENIPKFSGGGWNKGFGNLFGGVKNFFGNMFNGLVKGPKGRDKVPAMLTDGEFVVSAGAVKKYGVDTFESMNAAGGGTNVPQISGGMTFAEGGGYIGGVGELRRKYDATHGEGAYDRESARRRASANATEEKSNLPSVNTGSEFHRRQRAAGIINFDHVKPRRSTPTLIKPQVNIKPPVVKPPTIKPSVDPRRQSERDANKKARAEYLRVIKDMSHPDYDKAWNDPNYMKNLRQKYMSQSTAAAAPATAPKPTPSTSRPGVGYTPYVSRFAGARDAAFAKARGQSAPGSGINPYNPMTWGRPGGLFGGPRMQARTDYAASKGKYYSSSDQKTYGNYNDAMAAKKSRMTSLASQQRLDKLSRQGASYYSEGKRYDAEKIARQKEYDKRGGIFGQVGRGLTSMFGTYKDIDKNAAADKASQARVKQAGAASIGRYYSSSDGKYYKDYNAAKLARTQRLKSGVKPPPKPKPNYNPAGGGMGGRRGSGSNPSRSGTKPPKFSPKHSAKSTRTAKSTLGIKR